MMTRVLVSVHFMRFKGNPAFWGVFLSLVWNFEFNDFLYCWLMSIVRIAYTSNFSSNLLFDIQLHCIRREAIPTSIYYLLF